MPRPQHRHVLPGAPYAKLAREAADASARKWKAADGGDNDAAPPPEDAAIGDAPPPGPVPLVEEGLDRALARPF